jgi:nicotinate dehydrogenase subunit B
LPEAEATKTAEHIIMATGSSASSPAARLYEGACVVCHEPSRGAPLANRGPALGLSSKLHAAGPANLLRLLLEGGGHVSGSMPGFATALDDRQILDLTRYLRNRFAPGQPDWSGIDTTLRTVRGLAVQ